LLPQLLELIYDFDDQGHHIIIVVGEPSPQTMASVVSKVNVLQFADVERKRVSEWRKSSARYRVRSFTFLEWLI
jgi:hypothetical protein